ncbi:DUF4249 domain-containing protein [Flavobacterium enshiense]|uniref:DUF4249 domain-containing protein n=1 Tax=Flavobacterium enshiense TaxID=1341165 RepID=UPI00345D0E1A
MKKIIQNTFLLIFVFSVLSCEKVVDADLDTAAPRLVVDASIQWIKNTSGNEQKIKLTTTTAYYNTTVPAVSGATVFITNSSNVVFNFPESGTAGEYVCNDFQPVIGETYTLKVIHNGQTFIATEVMTGVPDIEDTIEQNNEGGFTGDEIEIKFFYQDNGLEDNFYMISFKPDYKPFPDYDVLEDRFFQGNQMFGLYSDEDLAPGNLINIKLYGISRQYYNYMSVLLALGGSNGGSPFQSPPATVRGNIINPTNENNYALGYFNLSEVDTTDYSVQ